MAFVGSARAGIFTSLAEMKVSVSHTNPCLVRAINISCHCILSSWSLSESVLCLEKPVFLHLKVVTEALLLPGPDCN